MRRVGNHWLTRAAFLPLSVALVMSACLIASEVHPPGYADRGEIQPGPPIAGEEQKPQPPVPTQPLTPSHEQPWQTSWEAFCGELQRLYKRGATKKEMNALFTGKSVTWEGVTGEIYRATNIINLQSFCDVTTADNRSEYVWVIFSLHFRSAAEIPNDLRESAKVRFSMTLAPLFNIPDTGQERVDQPSPEFDDIFGEQAGAPLVGRQWWDPIDIIIINSEAKLLEYEKIGDHPLKKSPEGFERNLEGRGKQLEKLERGSPEKHNQER